MKKSMELQKRAQNSMELQKRTQKPIELQKRVKNKAIRTKSDEQQPASIRMNKNPLSLASLDATTDSLLQVL